MRVVIYGKPGCGKCEEAKKHVAEMGFDFEIKTVAEMVVWHEGWRDDNSVNVMACYAEINLNMPIIEIQNGSKERKCYDYPKGMKVLKGLRK